MENKFWWTIECLLYSGDSEDRVVTTDTESWYEAEDKILAMPDVWDVGNHYILERPDGTYASC